MPAITEKKGYLVLSRRIGEKVIITVPASDTDTVIEVAAFDIERGKCRLGFSAPLLTIIEREELRGRLCPATHTCHTEEEETAMNDMIFKDGDDVLEITYAGGDNCPGLRTIIHEDNEWVYLSSVQAHALHAWLGAVIANMEKS